VGLRACVGVGVGAAAPPAPRVKHPLLAWSPVSSGLGLGPRAPGQIYDLGFVIWVLGLCPLCMCLCLCLVSV
jgi:hypothetical protein